MAERRTLLGVFAHPDDESFGSGGTLARYAREGKDVHIIIATDGIAGSVEEGTTLVSHETLAQVRAAELSNATVALGVKSIWSLPYRDSGMRGSEANQHADALIRQPIEKLTQEILFYLDRLQPDVIITHDPFGGYGHPDHIRCCEAVTAAFHIVRSRTGNGRNGYAPQKLYYSAFDKRLMKVIVKVMPYFRQNPRQLGRNKDIDLVEISRWDTPVHARINIERYLPYKQAASEAHVSQYSGGPGFLRFLPALLRRRFMANETYTRAFPAPNRLVESDLFAGVT